MGRRLVDVGTWLHAHGVIAQSQAYQIDCYQGACATKAPRVLGEATMPIAFSVSLPFIVSVVMTVATWLWFLRKPEPSSIYDITSIVYFLFASLLTLAVWLVYFVGRVYLF